jgi:hypothetical protein
MGLRLDFEVLLALIHDLNSQDGTPAARESLNRMLGSVTSTMTTLAEADLSSLDDDYLSEVFALV